MPTLSAYVLRQTMTPLLLTVAIALAALLTERMLRLLDLVLSSSGSLQPLLQLLTFLVPHYMALALPIAFFLGVLLAISGLQQRSELDVIAASGIGMLALLRPILGLAAVLALLSALNFGWAQPYARYLYRALLHNVTDAFINISPQQDTFMEVAGVTFLAEEVDLTGNTFGKIFIYRELADGSSEAITAKTGRLHLSAKGQRSLLVLEDGARLEVHGHEEDLGANAQTAADGRPPESESRALLFDRLQVPIDLVTDSMFRPRGRDQREFTIVELWPYDNTLPGDLTRAQASGEFHDRAVRTLSILFLPLLAAGIAIGQRRVQRSHVIVVGLLALIVYDEVLVFGRYFVSIGELPSLVAQWLPFVAMAASSAVLFHRAAYRIQRTWALYDLLAWLEETVRGLLPGVRTAPRGDA
jgi:lipopolysaccharide export system permease protein